MLPESLWIRSWLLLRDDKVEESSYCGAGEGMGTADTSEIIRVKNSATRPAREQPLECIVTDQPIKKGDGHRILI